jgi:predicted PurR-regulated permease PerM
MLVIFLGTTGGFTCSGFIGMFTGVNVLSLDYNLMMNRMGQEKS